MTAETAPATATALHDTLAALLEYPSSGYAEKVAGLARDLAVSSPAAAAALAPFVLHAASLTSEEAEEAYIAAFDTNSECALEVGWHVYGETYQRGVFLVQMRRLLFETGVEESNELPDHLVLLLRALGRAEKGRADRLTRLTVLPAIRKIGKALEEKKSPYRPLIASIALALGGVPAGATSAEPEEGSTHE
jgi:nitrate reductase delta subunit